MKQATMSLRFATLKSRCGFVRVLGRDLWSNIYAGTLYKNASSTAFDAI
jgi:hypothetical protein